MEELLRMWRGRELQVVGAATAKLRESKHVRTQIEVALLHVYYIMFIQFRFVNCDLEF